MSTTALTRHEASARAGLITDVSYDVALDVSDAAADTFGSHVTARFKANAEGAETFLDLVADRVERLVVNGVEQSVDATGPRIALTDLTADNVVEIWARCTFSRAGVGMHRFVDPVDDQTFLYTQFEPSDAHRVYACFDQPDIKAAFTFSVEAPADWRVISNAAVDTAPPEGEAGLWVFQPTARISTYVTAVVAGPYDHVSDRHGDVELGLYCRRSMSAHLDPEEIFALTKQGLDYFADVFDYPYPFGKYDQLFVPEFNFGAMENPGCVTFSERYIFRSKVTQASRLSRANTILHEMAHMWFGDLVTMRWWDDLWLNESFATFMAHQALAEGTRFGRASWSDFAHGVKAWAYQQDQLPSTHPIVAEVPDTESVMANFDGITYAKGASVLKQLHAWVGAEAFAQGLRDYFPAHAYGNAELADFLSALEGPSGRELTEWSKLWLETSGVSTLRTEVEEGADGLITSMTVHQTTLEHQKSLRPHRLAIGLYDTLDGQLTRMDTVEVDIDGAVTTVDAMTGRFRPELILLNDEDLAYAKVRLDARSVATLERALGTMSDSVSRAVCWGALWDSTRDAELAARRFVDLVCEHGPVEADITVLQTLLAQGLACADRFGDPDNAAAVRTRLGSVSAAGLQRAETGSDRQLIWLRARIASRTDPEFGLSLLDGSLEIEGVPMDPDLRWYVVGHLAATGHLDAAAIAEEKQLDPTDAGVRGAERALASIPTAEAKETAWSRALDRALAMHTRRAALRGFWQPNQPEVLAPYAHSHWVNALPGLWGDVSAEEGLAMTDAVYPGAVVDMDVVDAADRAMALPDLSSLAIRSIRENKDATQRALRARVADRPKS